MFNKTIRKKIVAIFAAFAVLLTSACSNNTATPSKEQTAQQMPAKGETRTITDMKGTKVEVPKEAKRVADLWHANNQVMLLLGGKDKLVATTTSIQKNAWMSKIFPNIKNISAPVQGQDLNIEELLKTNPDVVITSDNKQYEDVKTAGLTPVYVSFQNFEDLKKCVSVTADAMGGTAPKIAEEFNKELDANVKFVKDRLKNLPNDQKPKVLHIGGGEDLLQIDGQKSMIGEWMTTTGAVNSIPDAENKANITIEQIVASNPDIIIIGGSKSQEGIDKIKKDPAWKNIKAVKENKLIRNPVGTFHWDRYSCEEALQVLWAAKTFHPDKFKDLDMPAKTKEFYKKYYNYDLSDRDAQNILDGKNPS